MTDTPVTKLDSQKAGKTDDGAGARELPQRIKELFNLSENDGAGVPLVNTCPVCRPYAKKGYQELSDGRTVPCYACNRAEFVKQAVAERGEVGSPFKELAKGPHLDTAAIHEDGTVTHHPAKLMKLKPEVGSVGQGERDEIRKSMDSLVNAVPDSICKSGTAMHEGRSQSRLDNDRLASVEVGTDTCSWALSDCTRAATHITGKGILLCADHAKVYGAREKVFPLAYVSPSAQPEAGAVTHSDTPETSTLLRVLMEETVLAGFPAGDREQTLANVRKMRKELEDCQHDIDDYLCADHAVIWWTQRNLLTKGECWLCASVAPSVEETSKLGSAGLSRSVQRRVALQRGEPIPTFEVLRRERTEGICDECGKDYPTPWFADNPVWNGAKADGFLCIECFIRKAQANGIKCTGWHLIARDWVPPQDCKHQRQNINNVCIDCGFGEAPSVEELARQVDLCFRAVLPSPDKVTDRDELLVVNAATIIERVTALRAALERKQSQ
jgi:hypothetical protein